MRIILQNRITVPHKQHKVMEIDTEKRAMDTQCLKKKIQIKV